MGPVCWAASWAGLAVAGRRRVRRRVVRVGNLKVGAILDCVRAVVNWCGISTNWENRRTSAGD